MGREIDKQIDSQIDSLFLNRQIDVCSWIKRYIYSLFQDRFIYIYIYKVYTWVDSLFLDKWTDRQVILGQLYDRYQIVYSYKWIDGQLDSQCTHGQIVTDIVSVFMD